MPNPEPLEFFYNALAVPPEERHLPLQRVLDTGHIVELRADQGRFYLCGLPHELPIEPDDSLLESILEQPLDSEARGFIAFEPAKGQLILWSEILPGVNPGDSPRPDLGSFLKELTALSKKVSLAGAL
jgi:hypothetical protein